MTKSRARPESNARALLHEVIFEADTRPGKAFDILLIICIVASICVAMLDSVSSIRSEHGETLERIEWIFTILFTIEYVLRLVAVRHPLGYALSFYGVVDLLAVIPTYLSVILPGSEYFRVIRVLRLLRVFRVLKLFQYVGEAEHLVAALNASRRKIIVFLFAVATCVMVFGSAMYVVEGAENGFTSIPRSIYWAIVTLTTVGYGDISPRTGLGQALAAVIMIFGYGIIAVPTGIVTAEMTRAATAVSGQACKSCSIEGHCPEATYCWSCGSEL